MVMDKGLSIREAEDFMEVGSEYTDFVKLGFGTSLLTPGFEKKIILYKKSGTVPYFGGTLFEAFIIRDMLMIMSGSWKSIRSSSWKYQMALMISSMKETRLHIQIS